MDYKVNGLLDCGPRLQHKVALAVRGPLVAALWEQVRNVQYIARDSRCF